MPKKTLRTLFGKTQKTHRIKSSSGSKSSGNSHTERLKRKYTKATKTLRLTKADLDDLSHRIDLLEQTSKSVFGKTRKNKPKSKSSDKEPILITIKNLDNGQMKESIIVKNINTGKYEFH